MAGDDEALVEHAVLTHPYLDVYPPMSIREWDEYRREHHPLDVR
jgi:hypothetical protein